MKFLGVAEPISERWVRQRTVYQAVIVVHPDGASVTNEFYPNGLLFRTYGTRSYPVAYGYDAQGRLRHMTNWTAFPGTGARVTTWNYDSERGWLTNKRYPDNLGPDYTYTAAGRLATRVWARGSPRISTTYGYNNAGEPIDVNYSDATPDVATGTDRRGRPVLITQGTNTWKLSTTWPGSCCRKRAQRAPTTAWPWRTPTTPGCGGTRSPRSTGWAP